MAVSRFLTVSKAVLSYEFTIYNGEYAISPGRVDTTLCVCVAPMTILNPEAGPPLGLPGFTLNDT
jgi:hypothetical protein